MPTTRGTCLLIRNSNGKFLLQFRDATPGIKNPLTWDFFGGRNDDGESDRDCAMREMKEELGIDAKPHDFHILFEITVENIEQVCIEYTRTIEWSEFEVFEGAGCGFFTLEEILQLPTPSYIRLFAQKLLQTP